MEYKMYSLPGDDRDPNEFPSVGVAGQYKRASLVASIFASILALSGLALFGSWDSSWGSPVSNLKQTDSTLDVVSLAAKQKALTDGWMSAVQNTLETAQGLDDQISRVKEAGDQAADEIEKWAEAESAKNNMEIGKYVKKMAHAAVVLVNIETDFKSWVTVQYNLFRINHKRLSKKFDAAESGVDINIDCEFKILDRAVDRGLKSLKEMMKDIQSVQVDFKVLAAQAGDMLRKVKEARKTLLAKRKTGHDDLVGCGVAVGATATVAAAPVGIAVMAAACTSAASIAGVTIEVVVANAVEQFEKQKKKVSSLHDKADMLGDKAERDYKTMSKVKTMLETLDALMIKDVDLFNDTVMPEIEKLVDLLLKIKTKLEIGA